jgi:hypothetical protein
VSERIRLLLDNRRAIDMMIAKQIERDYPIDEQIEWTRGGAGKRHFGRVVMHCRSDRVKVRNDATGKELFIRAYDIVS